jgi:phosphatidylserine/phosphatidylglycerophosphate/cardiolipin synthase-like enzyme
MTISTAAPAPRAFIARCLAAALLALGAQVHAQTQTPYISARFSPGGAAELVLQTIKSARREIDLAAYQLTSSKIANALIAAHKRGVRVSVVADPRQNQGNDYSKINTLAHQGVPVRLNGRYAHMHNKFCVVDGITLQTGSFNYTRAAEAQNAENVVVIHDAALAGAYREEFIRLWEEADPVQFSNDPPASKASPPEVGSGATFTGTTAAIASSR